MILLLNKEDVLEDKVLRQNTSLKAFFPSFAHYKVKENAIEVFLPSPATDVTGCAQHVHVRVHLIGPIPQEHWAVLMQTNVFLLAPAARPESYSTSIVPAAKRSLQLHWPLPKIDMLLPSCAAEPLFS